jgi:hypothetical protein
VPISGNLSPTGTHRRSSTNSASRVASLVNID